MARSLVLHRRPNTFAQTNLSVSFFACDTAADHTFLFADNTTRIVASAAALLFLGNTMAKAA